MSRGGSTMDLADINPAKRHSRSKAARLSGPWKRVIEIAFPLWIMLYLNVDAILRMLLLLTVPTLSPLQHYQQPLGHRRGTRGSERRKWKRDRVVHEENTKLSVDSEFITTTTTALSACLPASEARICVVDFFGLASCKWRLNGKIHVENVPKNGFFFAQPEEVEFCRYKNNNNNISNTER